MNILRKPFMKIHNKMTAPERCSREGGICGVQIMSVECKGLSFNSLAVKLVREIAGPLAGKCRGGPMNVFNMNASAPIGESGYFQPSRPARGILPSRDIPR